MDKESRTVSAESDLSAGGVAAELDGTAILRRNNLRFTIGETCDGFRAIHREAFIQFVCFEPIEAAELHRGFEGKMPLVEGGYLEKVPVPHDRRMYHFKLLDKATALLPVFYSLMRDINKRALSVLSDDERKVFLNLLGRVNQKIKTEYKDK